MTCEEFGERLTAFSLAELPEDATAACRGHLDACTRCNNLVLRDLQLVSALRGSAVPAPVAVQQSVRIALGTEHRRRRRRLLGRGAGAAAAAALAGVLALVGIVTARSPETPRPDPATATTSGSAIAAAWDAYEATALPLDRALPPGERTPDLRPLGLRIVAYGTLTLAGEPATAVEYRESGTTRLTIFRWRGKLRRTLEGYPSTPRKEMHSTRWGPTQSAWWDEDGWVWCVVGNLPQRTFPAALDRIRES
jgi:anti-sigma factor RsiW